MAEQDVLAEEFLATVMRPRRRARPRAAEPLRGVDMTEVRIAAGEVAAWRLGEGPAVLLVHGWEDDSALWTRLMLALTERGRAVVALDLPGHGFSGGDQCAPPDAAEAAAAVAAALGPVDAVVAHSFGCPASVLAIERGMDVERVVLIGAPLGRRRRWKMQAREIGVPDDIVKRAKEIYAARVGGAAAGFDMREAAKRMRAQALFIHSADDEQVPFDGAQEAAGLWPGAQFMLVDGLGHRLVAQDPDIVAQIADFLG